MRAERQEQQGRHLVEWVECQIIACYNIFSECEQYIHKTKKPKECDPSVFFCL